MLYALVEKIKRTFECYFIADFGKSSYEIEFGTSGYPKHELEGITEIMRGKARYNIWVFSHDNSEAYYGFHTCENGEWNHIEKEILTMNQNNHGKGK